LGPEWAENPWVARLRDVLSLKWDVTVEWGIISPGGMILRVED